MTNDNNNLDNCNSNFDNFNNISNTCNNNYDNFNNNSNNLKIPTISIISPVYNEEDNILELGNEIYNVLLNTRYEFELIFVNDGSTDKTAEKIDILRNKYNQILNIEFKKNYGQTAAIMAGINKCKGDIIVLIDGDLQNDPSDIPKMIDLIKQGYDVVSGWRKNRKDDLFLRRLPSTIANKIISIVTKVKLNDFGCTLKAYKKDILKNIKLFGDMHRFIPVYAEMQGAKIIEIEVNHRHRKYGKSKYGLSRITKVVLDLFTLRLLLHYNSNPMHFFGKIGLIFCGIGSLSILNALYDKLFLNVWVHRNPLLIIGIFFILLGTQFIFNGLLAELLIRIFYSDKTNKLYFTK